MKSTPCIWVRFPLKCLSNAFIVATKKKSGIAATSLEQRHSVAQATPGPGKRNNSIYRVSKLSEYRKTIFISLLYL